MRSLLVLAIISAVALQAFAQFPMMFGNQGFGWPQQNQGNMFPGMGQMAMGNMGIPNAMPNMGMGGMPMPMMQAAPDANMNPFPNFGGFPLFNNNNAGADVASRTLGAPASQPKPQEDYLWFCLEDIFPAELRNAAGIPPKIGELMSSYATHAYVMLGPNPRQAMAWQVQLNEGMQYWASVLMESMHMDTEHPVEWGLSKAEMVVGTTKMSTQPGEFVYSHSKKCFKSKEPSRCTSSEIHKYAIKYTDEHPRFNLAHTNCALFACHVLNHCSAPGDEPCDPFQCMNSTATKIMADKDPLCNMVHVVDRPQQQNNMAGLTFGISTNVEADQTLLADAFPMHTKAAKELVQRMMKERDEAQHVEA